MHFTRSALYAIRLPSIQLHNPSSIYRRLPIDFLLATAGFSLSMYGLMQMQKMPSKHRTHVVNSLRRLVRKENERKLLNKTDSLPSHMQP